jgi:membrane protein YqaA with SNARE-associated domain
MEDLEIIDLGTKEEPKKLFTNKNDDIPGVPLTKNHANQLIRKINRAIYRRNRLEFYLLFSKNIHWIIYWPSVTFTTLAGCIAFVGFSETGQSNSIGWLNILTGVLSMLGAAFTAINGAAKFPAREEICREFVARWGYYADKYETLLNKRYSDINDTSKIIETAIEEFAELENKSPDIPTIVMKLYKRSSIAREIDLDKEMPTFNLESEPELLSQKKSDTNLIQLQPDFIPDLQRELDASLV